MNVLMIRLGGLGDLLVAAPSMARLRRAVPAGGFTLICRGEYEALMRDSGIADAVLAAEGRDASWLFGGTGAPPADRNAGVPLAVAWMQGPAPAEMDGALRSAGFRTVAFSARNLDGPGPLSRRFFDATRAVFPSAEREGGDFESCARLRSAHGEMTAARSIIRPDLPEAGAFAVVHPGSGGRSKLWPLERYLELVGRMAATGVPGVLVTGETEERAEIAGLILTERLPGGWSWARRPPLLALAGLLAEAPLYLGNDSGVTHLAAACGARVTALFPDAHRSEWEPYGRSRVLSAGDVREIDTDSVWAVVREEIGRGP